MNNTKLYLQIFIIFVPLTFKNFDTIKKTVLQERADTLVHIVPKKIKVQTLENQNSQQFDWSKNMPWIGAIIIGFTTVGANIFISKSSRNSSLQIALKQMELAKTNNEKDFKKTVISLNKQAWINDFRINISELVSLAIVLANEQKFDSNDHAKLLQLVTKAELMLSGDTKHLNLSQLLEELKTCCISIIAGNSKFEDLEIIIKNVKQLTLDIIGNEWNKALNPG